MPYGTTSAERALRANFGSEHLDDIDMFHVALHRQETPGDVATVLGDEPTADGGYARVAVQNTDAQWEIDGLSVTNVNEIRWPIASDLWSVGEEEMNQWAIYDLSTGGDLIAWGTMNTTVTVTGAGDQPVIPAENLTITQVI